MMRSVCTMKNGDFDSLKPHFPEMERGKAFWGFVCFSRQDYAGKAPLECEDQIMLGIQCREGGCYCEMVISWYNLGKYIAPRLECFDEAWPALRTPTFIEVLRRLTAGKQNMTPDEMSRLLIDCGFKDLSDSPLPGGSVTGENNKFETEESV